VIVQHLSERKDEMLAINSNHKSFLKEKRLFGSLPEMPPENELDILLASLSPDVSWGERQAAARKIGRLGNSEALPALLAALPVDNFWMVRCEIIQALERIADPAALSALRGVAQNDRYKVVREYATKAVQRLS
jgi:HEAT repeat protein